MEIVDSIITDKNLGGIMIMLEQTRYNISIVLSNLQFYGTQKMALLIIIKTFAKLLIKNCTFMLNQLIFSDLYNSMLVIAMKTFNVTITFLNCNFHQNNGWHSVISILTSVVQSHSENSTCPTRPNIILEGCDFINNVSPLI